MSWKKRVGAKAEERARFMPHLKCHNSSDLKFRGSGKRPWNNPGNLLLVVVVFCGRTERGKKTAAAAAAAATGWHN